MIVLGGIYLEERLHMTYSLLSGLCSSVGPQVARFLTGGSPQEDFPHKRSFLFINFQVTLIFERIYLQEYDHERQLMTERTRSSTYSLDGHKICFSWDLAP